MADRGVDFADGDQISAAFSTAEPRAPGKTSGPVDFPDGGEASAIPMNAPSGDMPPTGGVKMESPCSDD